MESSGFEPEFLRCERSVLPLDDDPSLRGTDRERSDYLDVADVALSQMSYSPKRLNRCRYDLHTSSDLQSGLLNLRLRQWSRSGMIRQPPRCKRGALPVELRPHWLRVKDLNRQLMVMSHARYQVALTRYMCVMLQESNLRTYHRRCRATLANTVERLELSEGRRPKTVSNITVHSPGVEPRTRGLKGPFLPFELRVQESRNVFTFLRFNVGFLLPSV